LAFFLSSWQNLHPLSKKTGFLDSPQDHQSFRSIFQSSIERFLFLAPVPGYGQGSERKIEQTENIKQDKKVEAGGM
jgi:hypothetical protein